MYHKYSSQTASIKKSKELDSEKKVEVKCL